MGNVYDKMSPEQLAHWYEYNKKYALMKYQKFCFNLDKEKDAEIINYFKTSGLSTAETVRKLYKDSKK
jgi:hypothetical protein